jgi:hypothetical protein
MSAFPRTLFVLKWRENNSNGSGDCGYSGAGPNPYADTQNWGDGDHTKEPLSSGLYNSARMVTEMLKAEGVPVKLVHVDNFHKIHKELVDFKADVVVIEAFWVVPEKFDELQRVCPNVKFVIRNHSETPFLANEGIAFDWTLEYVKRKNVIMTCNAPRMLEETRFLVHQENPHWTREQVDYKVAFLPNYYPLGTTPVNPIDPSKEFVDIGCFGAVRPLKNHMLQAIAAMKFAARGGHRIRFHINGGRIEMNGGPILKNLFRLFEHYPKHQLVNHRWMNHADFRALVASMDLVTQVSFSETFNIVAADAITQGVATVTSNEVPWSSPVFQANPVSSDDMALKLEEAYRMKIKHPRYNPSLHGLNEYNLNSIDVWIPFLRLMANMIQRDRSK